MERQGVRSLSRETEPSYFRPLPPFTERGSLINNTPILSPTRFLVFVFCAMRQLHWRSRPDLLTRDFGVSSWVALPPWWPPLFRSAVLMLELPCCRLHHNRPRHPSSPVTRGHRLAVTPPPAQTIRLPNEPEEDYFVVVDEVDGAARTGTTLNTNDNEAATWYEVFALSSSSSHIS